MNGKAPHLAEHKVADSGAGADATHSISALAKEFGITTRTIRFYESRGLISPQRIGTARRYSKRDRARLMLILRGRNLGFSIEDVSQYLALYDADPGQLAQTRLLLDKVRTAINELQMKRRDIERSLADLSDIRARCEAHLKRGD
ncbi:MerR family DNA-binding transcriptional regulator [Hyphomicrobium sp.]|jgi:DNA-binding transcriptional MerR regulator|uniref:MerR family transcriptional regulator n=1 Tax=Hyphomicrobium sp. TaxID=82 RepID=UPI002C5EE478|nr:MerR family DNA-binding transcriptional regulator [Hyphomicrobium sp.]HVZ06261.1 MerR family DNA-binding transcriptional regulator [Hyphomicrobium sp.]